MPACVSHPACRSSTHGSGTIHPRGKPATPWRRPSWPTRTIQLGPNHPAAALAQQAPRQAAAAMQGLWCVLHPPHACQAACQAGATSPGPEACAPIALSHAPRVGTWLDPVPAHTSQLPWYSMAMWLACALPLRCMLSATATSTQRGCGPSLRRTARPRAPGLASCAWRRPTPSTSSPHPQ